MPPLIITITNNLRLKNVPPDILNILTEKLKLLNPKWLENEKMRRWNRGTPKELLYYDKVGTAGLWIPRGYMRQLILLCRRHEIKYEIEDRRRSLPHPNFSFRGKLRPFQQVAVDGMLAKDFGRNLWPASHPPQPVEKVLAFLERRSLGEEGSCDGLQSHI